MPLAKTMMPAFLPLIAYVAAEALFGETVGLAAGIALGLGEFAIVSARRKKADFFILADTGLLALIGALSLALRSPAVFRLKPALMEFPVAMALYALASGPERILAGWLSSQVRLLPAGSAAPAWNAALPGMRRALKALAVFLALHAALVIWAALRLSAAWWGFISGMLPYLGLGVAAAFAFLRARLQPKQRIPWSLHLTDGQGALYAVRPTAEASWDAALRGACAVPASAGARAAGRGTTTELPDALARELSGALASLGVVAASRISLIPLANGEIIALAEVDRACLPRGADPSLRRFWRVADLEALRGSGSLSPGFERELGVMTDPALYGKDGPRL